MISKQDPKQVSKKDSWFFSLSPSSLKKKGAKALRVPWLLLPCLLLLFLLPTPLSAKSKDKTGWQTKNNIDYYYSKEKVPLTGLQSIKGLTYFFQEDGKQYHGWKEIGGAYYCFGQGRKKKGCMVNAGTPNGFSLDETGAALLQTDGERERMQALAFVSELMNLRCKSTWGKRKKLKSMYNFALLLPYRYDDTDKTAAQCVLKFSRWIDGDCADTNSFLAFAGCVLGLDAYVVNDFGHWWAQIDGLIYDTNYTNFAAPLQEAVLAGFPYVAAQSVPVHSPLAGNLMMTVHPDRYGYATPTPTPEDFSPPLPDEFFGEGASQVLFVEAGGEEDWEA